MNAKFVWNGDEAGLWVSDKHIASLRELETAGYSVSRMLGLNQKQLDKLATWLAQ